MTEFGANSQRAAEYTVARVARGRRAWWKPALITAYIVFGLSYFVFFFGAVFAPSLIALLPAVLWILIDSTWKRVFCEFTVRVDSGQLYVTQTVGRKKKTVLQCALQDIEYYAPYQAQYMENCRGRVTDVRGDLTSPDGWFLLLTANGRPQTVVMEFTQKLHAAIYYHNRRADGDPTLLRY